MWKITCYNGMIWEAENSMFLIDAIKEFIRRTGLVEMDIKSICRID